ncbi:MAG: response regulator [Pseudomonadota bacterium]|nr:response regulator [Pseudomonadota bacterium]
MSALVNVLVVEDGEEYTENLSRFCTDGFAFTRAGDGGAALGLLAEGTYDLAFLDMRFDRVQPGVLLGDLAETAERFNGDPVRARQFLEEHQGAYILAAIRAAGHTLPAVFSHDFDGEPRRWANLVRLYAPVSYLPDNAAPSDIRETFLRARRHVRSA